MKCVTIYLISPTINEYFPVLGALSISIFAVGSSGFTTTLNYQRIGGGGGGNFNRMHIVYPCFEDLYCISLLHYLEFPI